MYYQSKFQEVNFTRRRSFTIWFGSSYITSEIEFGFSKNLCRTVIFNYYCKRKLKIPFFHEDTKDQIKYLFQKFALNAEHQCASKRYQFLHRTLQSLSNNIDIKVCKLDKGRGVAILNSDDYYAKLDNILADKSKFIKINTEQEIHPIIVKENSIRYYVRKYLKDYGDEIIKSLIPSGSNPGKLYGLIKVHKDGNPARPVVSMIEYS